MITMGLLGDAGSTESGEFLLVIITGLGPGDEYELLSRYADIESGTDEGGDNIVVEGWGAASNAFVADAHGNHIGPSVTGTPSIDSPGVGGLFGLTSPYAFGLFERGGWEPFTNQAHHTFANFTVSTPIAVVEFDFYTSSGAPVPFKYVTDPPVLVTADPGAGQVSLEWEPATTSDERAVPIYRVRRSTIGPPDGWSIVGSGPSVGVATSYVDTGRTPDVLLYYTIDASFKIVLDGVDYVNPLGYNNNPAHYPVYSYRSNSLSATPTGATPPGTIAISFDDLSVQGS